MLAILNLIGQACVSAGKAKSCQIARDGPLELYFIDGKPDGMLTAEVFNWTGHVRDLPGVGATETC